MQHSKSVKEKPSNYIGTLCADCSFVILAKPDNRFILSNMFNQLAQSAKIKVVEIDSVHLFPYRVCKIKKGVSLIMR